MFEDLSDEENPNKDEIEQNVLTTNN